MESKSSTEQPIAEPLDPLKLDERGLSPNSPWLSGCPLRTLPGLLYRCDNDPDWTIQFVSDGCLALTGYSRAQFLNRTISWEALIHPQDRQTVRDRVRVAWEQHRPFHLEYRIITGQGEEKWVWDVGNAIGDSDPFEAREGFISDITERKQNEEKVHLLQTLTRAVGEAQDFNAAIEVALRHVCQTTHWVFGEAWVPQSKSQTLALNSVWFAPSHPTSLHFYQQSKTYHFKPSQGLPGKVWASGQSLWFPDVSQEPTFLRQELAEMAGLRAGFGVPIMAKNEVVAVLLFFSFNPRRQDRQLVQLVSAVAEQLGEMIHRRRVEAALQESERRLTSLINATEGIFFAAANDSEWSMTYISEGCEALTGYKSDRLIGNRSLSFDFLIHPSDRSLVLAAINRAVAQHQPYTIEYRLRTQSGREKWVWEKGHGVFDPQGRVLGLEGFITDITERKRSEEALRQAETKYRSIFENAVEGIFQTTPDGQYLSANPALARIYGYNSVEDLMKSLEDIEHQLYVSPKQRSEFVALMHNTGEVIGFESQIYRRDGSIIWISENARAVRDEWGKLLYYEGMVEDVTERKQIKEKLHLQAYSDPLTQLPNRALFQSRLNAALEQAATATGRGDARPYRFALLFLDLDRFKVVNDSLGHSVGDQLLVAIARRLEHCLRDKDIVARLGGDEFIVLLEEIDDVRPAIAVAERIVKELTRPFHLSGHQVLTSTSIGIVFSHHSSAESLAMSYHRADELLRDADTALYRAKALGRGRYEVFNATMRQSALMRLQQEMDLRQALVNKEFEIHYQPIVSLKTDQLRGFEALLRWRHPSKGLVYPNEFMSTAEETGSIVPIGHWMLREACYQLHRWQRQRLSPGSPPLIIHINLSSKQFLQPDLIEQIDQIFRETQLEGSSLRLEIAESLWLKNADSAAARTRLAQLKERNIQLCIEDFGTGYSRLNYLYKFPVNALKIERFFVSEIDQDEEKAEIARTIVMLAHHLGMEAIAEGIETPQQLEKLREFGCEFGQGYFFSQALDSQAAGELLRE